jgi:hypothetical protein
LSASATGIRSKSSSCPDGRAEPRSYGAQDRYAVEEEGSVHEVGPRSGEGRTSTPSSPQCVPFGRSWRGSGTYELSRACVAHRTATWWRGRWSSSSTFTTWVGFGRSWRGSGTYGVSRAFTAHRTNHGFGGMRVSSPRWDRGVGETDVFSDLHYVGPLRAESPRQRDVRAEPRSCGAQDRLGVRMRVGLRRWPSGGGGALAADQQTYC